MRILWTVSFTAVIVQTCLASSTSAAQPTMTSHYAVPFPKLDPSRETFGLDGLDHGCGRMENDRAAARLHLNGVTFTLNAGNEEAGVRVVSMDAR